MITLAGDTQVLATPGNARLHAASAASGEPEERDHRQQEHHDARIACTRLGQSFPPRFAVPDLCRGLVLRPALSRWTALGVRGASVGRWVNQVATLRLNADLQKRQRIALLDLTAMDRDVIVGGIIITVLGGLILAGILYVLKQARPWIRDRLGERHTKEVLTRLSGPTSPAPTPVPIKVARPDIGFSDDPQSSDRWQLSLTNPGDAPALDVRVWFMPANLEAPPINESKPPAHTVAVLNPATSRSGPSPRSPSETAYGSAGVMSGPHCIGAGSTHRQIHAGLA